MDQAHPVPRRKIIKKKVITCRGCFEMCVIFRKRSIGATIP
jgi:hypothetical protein